MLRKSAALAIVIALAAPGVAAAAQPTPIVPTLVAPPAPLSTGNGHGLTGNLAPPRGGRLENPPLLQAPPGAITSDVALKLERDGRLSVTERITAPQGHTLTRTVPLRFATGDRTDRVFRVTNGAVRGNGNVSSTADTFTARVTGSATVSYVVEGAVVRLADHEEVRWQAFSGWDTPFFGVSASLVTPQRPRRVDCLAGAADSNAKCASSGGTTSGAIYAQQPKLAAGDRLNLAVWLPPNTVPANAVTARTSAFALTTETGIWLLGLTVLLLAAVGLLWFTRGRDARVAASALATVEPIVHAGGSAHFASPEGLLPGQLGTVIDQHVDAVDVTATVLDLAVRNYLWVTEAQGQAADWWIVRRNPADDALIEYERAVFDAVLPRGAESVLLSELAGSGVNVTGVRSAMYHDVVDRGWFARRPDSERRRWRAVGAGIAGLGVLVTLALALTIGHALIGLAVVLGGIALAFAAKWMPARTRSGSALVRQIAGLGKYFSTTTAAELPMADREMVFSRSLPYALVLGQLPAWLERFADTDTAADGAPGLYWFATAADGERQGSVATVRELSEFTAGLPTFVQALDVVLAKSGVRR